MDKDRRKFLKILLIGSGTLLVGKLFGPLFSRFFDGSFAKTNSLKTSLATFRVDENKKKLSVYDDFGEEVLQIDRSE